MAAARNIVNRNKKETIVTITKKVHEITEGYHPIILPASQYLDDFVSPWRVPEVRR